MLERKQTWRSMSLLNVTGVSLHIEPGILEKVLIRRYGSPVLCIRGGLAAKSWNAYKQRDEAVLYVGMKWQGILGAHYSSLKEIYGNTFGGFLVGDSLRTALLTDREVWALWNIEELRALPAVKHAQVLNPAIDYFMDAANVWYYGHCAGELWEYDTEFDELNCLGPIASSIEELIDQWTVAGQFDRE